MDKSNNLDSSFFDLLCILFIYLKLIGVIDWSWWIVLSPEVVPLSLYLLVCALAYLSDK